ncbi:MAG: ABC transporter permease [Spirochaetia bacterium]|nr:ABC transporter permease [Spirochaetia bacterium]
MGKFTALYRKELRIFFSMPIAYAVTAVYAVLSGYFFSTITNYYAQVSLRAMNQYNRGQFDLSMIEGIFRPYFHNLVVVLILMVPILTMRLLAEEKREGTSELLFTYPVSDFSIVSAKFLSAFTVYASMIAVSLISFIMLRLSAPFELWPVLTGTLGLLLVGAGFIALGLFISATTESQIVAAVASFGVLLLFLLMPWAAQSAGPFWGKVLQNISIVEHFDSFAKGVINTGDITYCLSFFAIFFFLTLRVLESKQWRG